MPRYWIMAPVKSKPLELFEKVWQFDLTQNVISIGWKRLGDVSGMTKDELAKAVASAYSDKPSQTKGLYTNMLWAFYHEMLPGDTVVARRGRKSLAGVGKITGPAVYSPGENPHIEHQGFIPVNWQSEPRDKSFSTIVFPMHTLSELSEEQFRSILEGYPPPENKHGIEDQSEFILEKYLEDFIISNFNSIFKGRLQVYEDSEGNEGQQYATDIGSIDILAVEVKTKTFMVIELKKGRPSDRVVGQILRYMGWVKSNLCTKGETVKGLIICRDHDPKLTYALNMTSNIDVRYYSVSFKLKQNP